MSTTRSQLYRLARDLGNIDAVEHGYTAAGCRGLREVPRSVRRDGSSTGRETARSTTSSAPSASDRDGRDRPSAARTVGNPGLTTLDSTTNRASRATKAALNSHFLVRTPTTRYPFSGSVAAHFQPI